MSADNFGAEYATAPAFDVPYPAKQCACQTTAAVDHLREQIATLEEALREAWRVFDSLGAYQSDDAKLAVLSGHAFSSAAYRVRTAMLKVQRGVA
jgi:NADH:ubiquinone oxidoreductase subunit F (NADH-binding)